MAQCRPARSGRYSLWWRRDAVTVLLSRGVPRDVTVLRAFYAFAVAGAARAFSVHWMSIHISNGPSVAMVSFGSWP